MLSLQKKKQRPWLHLKTFVTFGGRIIDRTIIKLIKRSCWGSKCNSFWWNFTLMAITLCFEETEGLCQFSLWWLNNTKNIISYQCLSINQICVSLPASVLVVVVPLLALLCTTVMYLCQMTWLLLRLPILNARTSPTQKDSSYTEKLSPAFVLYAVCQWQTFTKMHEDAAFSLFDCDP